MNSVLGPFLMKPTSRSMGFWIRGDFSEKKLSVAVFKDDQEILEQAFIPLANSNYGVYLAESDKVLEPYTQYRYEIRVNGTKELLGLSANDFRFKTLPEERNNTPKYAFVSCNGIEEFEKHKKPDESAWTMWQRLEEISSKDPDLLFLISGGDQVYMDDTFTVKWQFRFSSEEQIRSKIKGVYEKYWGDISYRKVMARLPSFLMWDDHDLLDGFGSRPEQFSKITKGKEKKLWGKYRTFLTEAFYEFQACRNPGEAESKGPFTDSFQYLTKGFVLLDLRSERNVVKEQLVGTQHKAAIEAKVDALVTSGIDTLYFVSPVTIARMGGKIEHIIGTTANYLWKLGHNVGGDSPFRRSLFWGSLSVLAIFSAHMKLWSEAGHAASLFLFFFCGVNFFIDISNSRNYLPKKITWGLRGLNLLIMVLIAWQDGKKLFFSDVEDQICRNIPFAWAYISSAVISLGATVTTFNISRWTSSKPKLKKVFTLLGGISFVLYLVSLFWLGLPGKTKDFAIWMIPVLVTHLIGLLFAHLSILEAVGAIDTIADLDDDIKDSWSSDPNRKELGWFYGLIEKVQSKGIRVVVLAGDIHTGGVSKLSVDKEFKNKDKTVYQLVSSPVSYVPMAGIVEKVTSSNSINEMKLAEKSIYSYNVFYRCNRNFAVVQPSKDDSTLDVEFYFEDLTNPEIVRIS